MEYKSVQYLSKNGNVDASSISAPVICLYFSAHWCPPCRKFTPVLADLYKKWNENEKQIEIIFCSSDRDEKSFSEYFAEMPWLAIQWGDKCIQEWKNKCSVSGIPTLAVITKDGIVLKNDADDQIYSLKEKALEEFKKLY